MEKKIKINSINLRNFAHFKNCHLEFNDKYTEIFGRNGSGKSSIADAIAFMICDLNYWGKSYSPESGTNYSMVSASMILNSEKIKNFQKTYEVHSNGSRSTKCPYSDKVSWINKRFFLSILNPRYLSNLQPNELKNLIVDLKLCDYEIFKEELSEETKNLISESEELIPTRGKTINELYALANVAIEELKQLNKQCEDEKKYSEGRINALNILSGEDIFNEEQINIFSAMEETNRQNIIEMSAKIDEYNKKTVTVKQFQAFLFSEMIAEFNKHLTFSSLSLDSIKSNGDPVIIMYLDGKEKKKLSSSESLKMGLDFCDAVSKLSGYNVPTVIDNAEMMDSFCYEGAEWLDIFENLNQVILLYVGKDDLSYYHSEEKILENIQDGSVMVRERDTLPAVQIIGDIW